MKKNKLLNKIRKDITPQIREKVIKATNKKIKENGDRSK
jgi:single-stranded DNA-specific DHH superfamily exonuclease